MLEVNQAVIADTVLQELYDEFAPQVNQVDSTNGYSFEFNDWRVNIRMSNTEPVVRLDVETRGDQQLLKRVTAKVLEHLSSD